VTSLSELSGLRLKTLNFAGCAVSDLMPIREMPLEELNLHSTRVTDLSPLIGMPIKTINLSMTPVTDFSPLAKLPLKKCFLQHNRIKDLTVLRDLPLNELVLWGCLDARNYAVLGEIKTLELLMLPSSYLQLPAEDYTAIGTLRSLPKLRQLGAEAMDGMNFAATGAKDVFWQDWDREQTFVPALHKSGFKFSIQKADEGTYRVDIREQEFSDLSCLKGAPISILFLCGCKVTDLSPLQELPLEFLDLSSNPVSDLTPLRGSSIKKLWLPATEVTDLRPLREMKQLSEVALNNTAVSDLTPLAGMPLKRLDLAHCDRITDVTPVLELPTLEELTVPAGAQSIERLRKLSNLKRLAYEISKTTYSADVSAEDFWKEFEANRWIARLHEAGFKPKLLKRLPDKTWEVDLNGTAITDLTILKGAPISSLVLGVTAVADLEPLRGMAIRRLLIHRTQVTDLTPLKGMPLDALNIAQTKVTDLSPLRGIPLSQLWLHGCADLTNLSPLADCKELQKLSLPLNGRNIEFLRALPKLERLSYTADTAYGYHLNKTATEFWKEYDANLWIAQLRDAGCELKTLKHLSDGTWEVNLTGAAISDLSILKGAPISNLNISETAVADLEPLRGMPLRQLLAYRTKVADLSPLQGMPLQHLNVSLTKVTDVSPVGGMPLSRLQLNRCAGLTDLSPLADCQELQNLSLPPNAKDIEFLRGFPKLERLSDTEDAKNRYRPDKTAAEFWKEYDGQAWLRALRASGIEAKGARLLPDGTWDVSLDGSSMKDLTLLKGAAISVLSLNSTAVTDLTPLHGCPLTKFNLSNTQVFDLGPLKGLPIAHLVLRNTKVTDLSALRGMPLTNLYLFNSRELTDLSPLADCRELTTLTLPPGAKDIEFLRSLPKLERISFRETSTNYSIPTQTAAEFWKEYDAQKK
jgi:Leucine-rich repeat (LRR) protein